MQRSATSQTTRKKLQIPTHIEQLQRRKNTLLSRSHLRGGHKLLQTQFKEVSTPFQSTAVTFQRYHMGETEHRIRVTRDAEGFERATGNGGWERDQSEGKRVSVPLRLLRVAKLTDESQNCSPLFSDRFNKPTRKQFLRKGTSINRAIMFNVLKSKYNKTVIDSADSYINVASNRALCSAIQEQVPKSLRDVVGAEQMLRMSNIFTGGSISSVNLHRKVNDVINKFQDARQVPHDDDEVNLKSIKRW